MFNSIRYVCRENFGNLFRIYSIAKYELLGDIRDSRFGIFWNFASPAIQVLTYWLVFGIGMSRGQQEGIDYLPWVVVGFAAWWYISPCITGGCSAIHSKANVITRMKFPISILPATVCVKEFFNHLFMLAIAMVVLLLYGFTPTVYWFGVLYYMVCAFVFVENLALITSVITMLWRDMKKLVKSLIRMILYLSPVLWTARFEKIPLLDFIMTLNPIYYIVIGYRDSLIFGRGIWVHPGLAAYFWGLNLVLFAVGCHLMYHFKKKMIDMI